MCIRDSVTLVVADATCLERNLMLVLQIMATTWPVVVCVNLLDEAARKHIPVSYTHLDVYKRQGWYIPPPPLSNPKLHSDCPFS